MTERPRPDVDGHTLEELSDYLDAGMQPADPTIDDSPACRLALASLRRVRSASEALVRRDVDREPPVDARWIERIIGSIALDARSGRTIPLPHPDPRVTLTTTEGAVRGLVRAVGDGIEGVLVGRCTLHGDVEAAGAPVRVSVDASVYWGQPIREVAARLQSAVAEALAAQTDLVVAGVDIVVHDIHVPGLAFARLQEGAR